MTTKLFKGDWNSLPLWPHQVTAVEMIQHPWYYPRSAGSANDATLDVAENAIDPYLLLMRKFPSTRVAR